MNQDSIIKNISTAFCRLDPELLKTAIHNTLTQKVKGLTFSRQYELLFHYFNLRAFFLHNDCGMIKPYISTILSIAPNEFFSLEDKRILLKHDLLGGHPIIFDAFYVGNIKAIILYYDLIASSDLEEEIKDDLLIYALKKTDRWSAYELAAGRKHYATIGEFIVFIVDHPKFSDRLKRRLLFNYFNEFWEDALE